MGPLTPHRAGPRGSLGNFTGQPAPTPTSAEAIKAPGRRALRHAANLVTADAVL